MSKEVAEEKEDNDVSQKRGVNGCSLNRKRSESPIWLDSEKDGVSEEAEAEENSFTEVGMAEDNEDNSGSEEVELSDFSDETLPAIAKTGRSANGNLKESGRRGFPGDPSFQQIDKDSKMNISISSDEDHASLSENKAKKQRKVCVPNSVFSTGQPPGVTRSARKWMFRKSKVVVNLTLAV